MGKVTGLGVREFAARSSEVRHGDLIDQASHDTEIHLAISIGRRTAIEATEATAFELRKVQGLDGICIDCDEAIPPKRRWAKPAAIRCCLCQEKLERE